MTAAYDQMMLSKTSTNVARVRAKVSHTPLLKATVPLILTLPSHSNSASCQESCATESTSLYSWPRTPSISTQATAAALKL